jgi:hypothetical protein
MKKLYFLALTFMIGFASFGQNPIITSIVDGDCSGGNPKLLEIYANGTVDFADYSLENQTNANVTWGNAQDLSSFGEVTNDFVYISISSSTDAIVTEFPSLGSAPVLLTNTMSVNGDDRVRIILTASTTVIDQYGVDTVDGSGESWEYADSYAKRVNGTGPDSSFNAANWTFGGAGALNGLGTCQGGADTFETLIGGVGTYTTTQNTEPTINITSPANGATLAPGTTMVNVEFTTNNLSGTETVNITVNGSTTNGVSSPFEITTTDGESYDVTVDLADGGVLDSDTVSFSVLSSNTVANIAALRAGASGEVFELTGEVLLTYQQSFRNQKFVEDATGAILIDDPSGVMSTAYNIADGITGIVGTLSEFGGTLQFTPIEDSAAASSTANALTPQAVTLAMLTANAEDYESELVTITAVTMDNTEPTFVTGAEYELTQSAETFNFRSAFFSADYIGANVPTMVTDITGIITERSGNAYYITARDADDFSVAVLSVSQFDATSVVVYPNPTSTGFVNITSANNDAISVTVFDILGKRMINQTLTNDRLNVSALSSGIYILKISQNKASVTKKLVIK